MSYLGVDAARPGTVQTVAYTGSSATTTNAISSGIQVVRLVANSACHFKVVEAAGGAATTADSFLPANWETYIVVTPGQKVSAIQAATAGLITATAGTLWVTEMSS
jgi:hypothetical protein